MIKDDYAETKEIIDMMASVKMSMNAHKGKIEDLNASTIIEMLRGEIDELAAAVSSGDSYLAIIEEAADSLNFLVALTKKEIERYRSRK